LRIPVGRSGTSLPSSTSCRNCPRRESRFWPKEFGYVVLKYLFSRTISDKLYIGTPQDSTSTSFLAAKAEMEDALDSIGKRKKGRPLRDSWRCHYQPLPGCWATSCSIRRNNPIPSPAPSSSRSNKAIETRSWTTDGGMKRWRGIRGTRGNLLTTNLHK